MLRDFSEGSVYPGILVHQEYHTLYVQHITRASSDDPIYTMSGVLVQTTFSPESLLQAEFLVMHCLSLGEVKKKEDLDTNE